ncbi:MAG: acyl-CoA dehydrogenase family protein [Acidimicrobiales bacterium]
MRAGVPRRPGAIAVARRFADEVLFPAALATDARDAVPLEVLDALAETGLYGVAAPTDAGGFGADFATVCGVQEVLAGGCLTTAFLWAQHNGLVHRLATNDSPALRERWLPGLTSGTIRAGVALGGALPRPTVHARRDRGGWRLEGCSPFVSGWGRIDVVHTAASTEDGDVVWLILDATEDSSLSVEPLELVALNATATVRVSFVGKSVPDERVTARKPPVATAPEVLRLHASLALGVIARCCRLLGPTPLDDQLVALRQRLDALGPGIAAARADAGELAVRAAAALMAITGGRSLLVTNHAQRLAREALFVLAYALRPASRDQVLNRLYLQP